MNYLINLVIYAIFIILIFVLKLNKRKSLPICIIVAVASLIIQMITDWVIGCVMYIVYDEIILYDAAIFAIAIVSIAYVTLTVWIISMVAKCSIKSKYVLIAAIIIFAISMSLQVADVKLLLELDDVVNNMNFNMLFEEFVMSDRITNEIKMVEGIRTAIDKIPAIIYMVAVLLGNKSVKNK